MNPLRAPFDLVSSAMDHPLIARLGSYWPIIFRATLYFFIGILPSIFKACYEFAKDSKPVNAWLMVAVGSEAVYQGCVVLRVYFDGSSVTRNPKHNGQSHTP
jgi:hypothetical protein